MMQAAQSRSGKGGLDMLEEWYAELKTTDRKSALPLDPDSHMDAAYPNSNPTDRASTDIQAGRYCSK
jgi:hypothetical protein